MKTLYTLALLCCAFMLSAQISNWNYLAPNRYYFGGQQNRIGDINFPDLQTGYATNHFNRYILKTTNGGDSWERKDCNIIGYEAQFITPQLGYITSGFELSKTTDGGDTWSLLIDTTGANSGMYQYYWDIYFLNAQRGYIAGRHCLWRTTDGGATWADIKPAGTDTTWHHIYFLDDNNGWLFGEDNKTWKTTDGGNTWTAVGNLPTSQSYDIVKATKFFSITYGTVITHNGDVLITTDGGVNWAFKTQAAANNIATAKFGDGGLVYAQNTGPGYTAISSDTGATWVVRASDLGFWSAHFFTPTHGFVAGYDHIYRTTDGVTFQTDSQNYQVLAYPIFNFDQLGNTKLYASTNFRSVQSTDNGASWIASQLNDVSIVHATNANCYYKQEGQTLYRYLNNVQTFALDQYFFMYATGSDSALAYTYVADSVVLMQTLNGGTSWTRFSAFQFSNFSNLGHFSTGDIFTPSSFNYLSRFTSWNNGVFAYFDQSNTSREFVTANHGSTWKAFSIQSGDAQYGSLINIKNSPSGRLYCARTENSYFANLYAYDAATQTWNYLFRTQNAICSGTISGTMDFDWSPDGLMWLSVCNDGNMGYLYYSLDDGISWNNSHIFTNYVTTFKKTYANRFLAGTTWSELMEYNGQFENNRIKGDVYYDFNRNNVKDGYDVYAPNHVVNSNGNESGITSSGGNYIVLATVGTHTLQPQLTGNYTPSPATRSVTISQQNTISTGNDFALQPVDTTITDLQIGIVPELQSAPGFEHIVNLYCSNNGVKPLAPVVTYVLDPVLTFTSSNPAPTSQSGDTLRWNLGNLNPLQPISIHISAMVAVSATLGNVITHKARVEPIAGDFTPDNNTATFERIIAGSYDPNMKEVTPDSIPTEQGYKKTSLQYTVHFQNTGTAPAHFVIIKDRLSPKLNWSSLRVVSASHSYRYHIEDKNLLVVTFENIMLPDSNNNEAESHGYVSFIIEPLEENISTNAINNYADIYFDYNSPITTNTARVTVSSDLNTDIRAINGQQLNIIVYPNPASNVVNLKGEADFTCTLRDLWGREILNTKSENNSLQMQVNTLAAGIYYLQVTQKGITQGYKLRVY